MEEDSRVESCIVSDDERVRAVEVEDKETEARHSYSREALRCTSSAGVPTSLEKDCIELFSFSRAENWEYTERPDCGRSASFFPGAVFPDEPRNEGKLGLRGTLPVRRVKLQPLHQKWNRVCSHLTDRLYHFVFFGFIVGTFGQCSNPIAEGLPIRDRLGLLEHRQTYGNPDDSDQRQYGYGFPLLHEVMVA